MRNGLYNLEVQMLDGVKARAAGVSILRDGLILGGDAYFYYTGSYAITPSGWKGELITHQHTPSGSVRPLFGGRDVSVGFSGIFTDDTAEVFGTALVGVISVSFRGRMRRLADA